ncbi:MAG: hypothetical protein ACE14T_08595 [Syntrophales bacterium]
MEREFIHLCQPDADKSCGACCGLYNYADSSRESLVQRLQRRTALFREIVRTPADLEIYAGKIRGEEDPSKLYEVIYCCEYLGFLGNGCRKVGCLLHPMQNGGVDLREASFYGKTLCEGHFCPSYHYISRQEKLALINIIDDWYLFGLCITDIDLVKEYFRFICDRIYEVPPPDVFRRGPLKEIAHRFFSFKLDWPFRSASPNRFGKYSFDGIHYMIPYIDYESLGCEKSRFDKIFLSLSSEFRDAGEVRAGEEKIQRNIDEFVLNYRR